MPESWLLFHRSENRRIEGNAFWCRTLVPKRVESMSLKPAAEELSLLLEKTLVCSRLHRQWSWENGRRWKKRTASPWEFEVPSGRDKKRPTVLWSVGQACEVYINDAFGTAHRAHASTAGVAALMEDRSRLPDPQGVGISGSRIGSPKAIYCDPGGAKSHKICDWTVDGKVDALIIGGGMANTFLKAQGMEIGDSLLRKMLWKRQKISWMKCKKIGVKIHLPVDICTAPEIPEVETKFPKVEDKVQAGWKISILVRKA